MLEIKNLVSSLNIFDHAMDCTYRNLEHGFILILTFDRKLSLLIDTEDVICDVDPVLIKLAILEIKQVALENDRLTHEIFKWVSNDVLFGSCDEVVILF